MHPNRRFAADPAGLLDAAARIGFAHIFAVTPDGPMAVHAPVTRHGERLRFHVARANRIAAHLDGATVLLSLAGAHGYVSPNWYERPGDQVPTWNYVTIEIDGVARPIGEDALVAQLDRLAETHEPRADSWRRTKMNPEAFGGMLKGIVGFEVEITAVRGTTKLGQNKSTADRAGVIAGLRAEGNGPLAEAMAESGA